MPYILESQRKDVEPYSTRLATTPGELNYQITRLCHWYLQSHGVRYDVLNTVVGALECVKQEFYRRRIAPYEDSKLNQNGDVY